MSSRFTQYILIAMALGIVMGAAIFNFLPDSRVELAADINLIAMLFLRLIKMIIAPLVFATLVGGIAHMGSGAKLGRVVRQDHGLVRQRLLRVAAARPRHGQPAAARRQLPRHVARQDAIDGPAGFGLLGREIPDPSDPDLDRRRDGAERDPADRGVRGVLRRGARRAARARQADHGPDRRSRPYHAEGDELCDAVRAARGVGGDHRDGGEERPAGAVEAHRLHGRLLSLADDPLGHPGRGRLHRHRAALQPSAAADPRAADDRVLDRIVGGGLSEDAGRASTASAPRRGSRRSCCRSAIPSTSTAR